MKVIPSAGRGMMANPSWPSGRTNYPGTYGQSQFLKGKDASRSSTTRRKAHKSRKMRWFIGGPAQYGPKRALDDRMHGQFPIRWIPGFGRATDATGASRTAHGALRVIAGLREKSQRVEVAGSRRRLPILNCAGPRRRRAYTASSIRSTPDQAIVGTSYEMKHPAKVDLRAHSGGHSACRKQRRPRATVRDESSSTRRYPRMEEREFRRPSPMGTGALF